MRMACISPTRRKNSTSKYIPRIGVEELLELDLEDLIVERAVLESIAEPATFARFNSSTA